MIEQQFLTTFNNISSYNNTARFKDKKTNLIIDFINGTYQGYLSSMMEPEGVGAIVDDQFNFILCSNWDKGKMNGQTFIKLANQIVLWGFWKQNAPKQLCSFKIGSYVMFIPFNNNKTKRPKKCLICNETKNKMYLVMIERYPQGTQSKRQFSIIIQKIMGMKEVSIERAAAKIDLQIKQYQLNMISYLNYMNSQANALKLSFKQNELFIYPNLNKDPLKCGMSLGLLLDAKKLCTKSVGMYSNLDNEEDQRESQMNSQNTEDLNKRKKRALNGLGLSKTKEFQSIIGIFKEDMLIKQMNSQEKIDSIRLEAKNFSRNLNGSVVKQLLGHEHMRSMSYQHNYLYFPEIKKVVTMAVQIHKYIDMFERLSPPAETQSDPNQSMHQHHASQKYLNNDLIVKQLESSGSIIDQYPEFKVNLKKDIYYREEGKLSKKSISNPITIEDQNLTQSKRPGFILNRSTRIHTQIEIKKSRSPSQKSPLKLNKKLPQRSPLKTEQRQNKWKN